MTTSSATSPVTRETTAFVRDRGFRPIIVTVTGGILELRCKGLKSREVLDIGAAYTRAAKERVLMEKREKAKARAAKRSAR